MTELTLDQDQLLLLITAHKTGDLQTLNTVGIDTKKGYLFTGPTGVGKTSSIRAMENPSTAFLNASTLFNLYMEYYRQSHGAGSHPLGYRNTYEMTIDDFGVTEPTITVMGTVIPFMTMLIDDRYTKFIKDNLLTNFTTNLNSATIEKLYGSRVLSRMYEMCNFITIVGVDLRKRS